jgi:alditol oxidase
MRQYVYEHLPVAELKENFNKIMSAGYSVSLFTDWQSDTINEVWIKSHENESTDFSKIESFFGAKAAVKNMHPIADLSAENCTEQMGVAGPWYERLPHFKMGFTPSSGKELQAEYFVPYENAVDAILAIAQLGKKTGPHLFISEIRSIAADDLWMSPCYNRKSVAIHFTWKQEWNDVQRLLPLVEKELSSFDCRPHWGKLFRLTPAQFASRYEKLNDFKSLVAKYDPSGKFKNDFLKNTILG